MIRMLDGFRFRRKESVIHRLDPRVKGLYTVAVLVAAVLYTEVYIMLLLVLLQVPLMLIAGIRREWLRSLRGSIIFALFIFTVNLISGYVYSGFRLTPTTLAYSTSMTLRFLTLIVSFSIFFLTTSPEDLGLAMEKLHIPYDFCFAFTSAIRFVPDLAIEVQSIIDAQKSRGLELEKGGITQRVRKYIPVLIPMFVRSFERSLELAEAMEARAYGAVKRRTSLYELKMRRSDYTALILITALLAAAVYIRYFYKLPELFPPALVTV